eukprot:Gregarina_sp_Pseudo_9__5194@NODE_567_length_2568_cov_11_176354_g536_i0_p1_GENE_NODE_567_length_2568_cov_11_176354_g536_i0NODE_567_length_2568_cov_11_176354_g536_i0_p1_ORF_typecomplete_len680_score108_91_NODE_567_length_2568_cov_11_176354_g536_i0632042
MSDSVLGSLFPPYALESQILPNGLYVVDSVTSPSPPSIPRPPAKRMPFSPSRVFSDPSVFAHPSRAEGYAKLTLNITRGVAEMYRHEQDVGPGGVPQANGAEGGNPPQSFFADQASPCCAPRSSSPGDIGVPMAAATPPFFPQFRVYLNDKAVYQTRVICLHKGSSMDPKILSASAGAAPASPASLADSNLRLLDVYDLEWNESSTYWIYSPATILTFQLIELDFCPDLVNSEDVLTSISIPLAPLTLNKPLDLLLNIQCTLPHSYSLESLVSEAERLTMAINNPDPASPMPAPPRLHLCPPTSVVCKVHVSLTLDQTRRTHNRLMSEIAALSLPRGPWTPGVLVDEVQPKDQLTLLCGTELLASHTPPVISVSYILKHIGSLLFSLTTGFDAIGSEQVVTLLGHNTLHYSLEDRKKLTYVAAGEDLATILEYLVLGPSQELGRLFSDMMNFRRIGITSLVVAVLWLPIFIPSKYMIPYTFMVLLLLADLLTNFHIPRKASKKGNMGAEDFLKAFGKIQGAKMLTKPIESALTRPSMIRRLRLLEVWLGTFRERIIRHELTLSPPSAWNFIWNFVADPIKVGVIFVLSFSEHSRRLACVGFAIIVTMILCRELPIVRSMLSFSKGLPRFLQLRQLRRSHVNATAFFSPVSQHEIKPKQA